MVKKNLKQFFLFLLMLSIFICTHSVLAEVYWINLFATEDGKVVLNESSAQPVELRKNKFFVREWSRGNYQAKIFSFKNELLDQIYFYPYNIFFMTCIIQKLVNGQEE
jgi:hypothetical protein